MIEFKVIIKDSALANLHSKADWEKAKKEMNDRIKAIACDESLKVQLLIPNVKKNIIFPIEISYKLKEGIHSIDELEGIRETIKGIIDETLETHFIRPKYIETKEGKEFLAKRELALKLLKERGIGD